MKTEEPTHDGEQEIEGPIAFRRLDALNASPLFFLRRGRPSRAYTLTTHCHAVLLHQLQLPIVQQRLPVVVLDVRRQPQRPATLFARS